MGVATQLRNAILHSAKLVRSHFINSVFSAAQLVGADLQAAVFFGCRFDEAHLYSANMVGADFILSRPWTARLYFPSNQDSIDTVSFEREGVGGINDLLDGCRELREFY